MKRDHCIEVKYANHLSSAYLTRFFGSVGAVSKVEKDENSKYVTIEFSHKNSVDKAFRFNGRVLDSRPIKIKKSIENVQIKHPQKLEQYKELVLSPRFYISESTYSSLHSISELWQLIFQEIKPHHYAKDDEKILFLLIGSLIELLFQSAKHIMKYKNNLRNNYLKNELERFIIDKISRKVNNLVTVTEARKINLEWRGQNSALVWLSVPYPNIQEDQAKIESESSMTKCINSIKNGLSLRIAQIVYVLNAASLCFNNGETGCEELMKLYSINSTSEDDNFEGIINHIGAKDVFSPFLAYQQENTCIFLESSSLLKTFQCTLRIEGCEQIFQDSSWNKIYLSSIIQKVNSNGETQYCLKRREQVQSINLKRKVLIFQYDHFSLQAVHHQLSKFRDIFSDEVIIFYLTKEKTSESEGSSLKFSEQKMELEYEKQPIEKVEKIEEQEEEQFHEEYLLDIIEVEIQAQNISLFNNLKITHYLEAYIQDSITSKGLVIPSREMAIKLAENFIDRQRENILFEPNSEKYTQLIGEELWRVYNKHSERKIKNILSKYARIGK